MCVHEDYMELLFRFSMYNIMTMRYDSYNPFLHFGNSIYIGSPN